MAIIIKTAKEIAAIQEAGKIVVAILQTVSEQVKVGMETRELDAITVKELHGLGAIASFKGYSGFPASLCMSVNDEIVHGVPSSRKLCEGDIVALDFGAIFAGFHADSAITIGVGAISPMARRLIETAKDALEAGIKVARSEAHLGDISYAIQRYAETRGYSVVREYAGHGIGRDLHEEPKIPNFGLPNSGVILKEGMTLALEPMINIGDWRTRTADDCWIVLTADGSLSAHFEHTIAITDGEPMVLTRSKRY